MRTLTFPEQVAKMAACEKVLNTHELLEDILLHLPVKDLLLRTEGVEYMAGQRPPVAQDPRNALLQS